MNKLYILLLLLYINIFCLNLSLCNDSGGADNDKQKSSTQILNSSQNSTANEIIKLLEGDSKQLANPCSHVFFKCRLIHNNNNNNNNSSNSNNNNNSSNSNNKNNSSNNDDESYYSITSISLPVPNNNSGYLNITSDLTVFQDLETIKIKDGSKILLPSSFYNNLNKFKNIRKIVTYYQISSINESIIIPPSLSIYQVFYVGSKFSSNFFNSSISKVVFNRALSGFDIPKELNGIKNEHLNSLTLPLSTYSPIIPISNSSLPNLATLSILVDLEMNKTQDFQFPGSAIESFSKMTNLSILTIGDNEKQLYQLPDFSNMKQLNELYIYGDLFHSSINSSIILDLSNSQNFKSLKLWNNYFLMNCTSKPCIKLSNHSQDVSIVSTFAQFNISNLNFNSISSLRVSFNKVEQPLPELPLDRVFKEFVIENSKIVSSIPDSYCGRSFNLSNNEIIGFVPSCFLCEKPSSSIYLGNFFKNYNESYTPTCPNFKIDNITNIPIIKTDGSEGIVISGNDIGYGVSSNYEYQVLVPNKKIKVFPGKGFGKSKDIKLSFFYNPKYEYQLNYSYQLPVIQFYNISSLNSSNGGSASNQVKIMIMGDGFNYINENQFYINDICYNGSIANDGSSTLLITNNTSGSGKANAASPFNSMKNGDTFEIYTSVGDQKSNPSIFLYLTEPITIDNSSLTNNHGGLNINGGQIIIKGSFYTSKESLASVSIDSKPCKILKFTESSILIKYPSVEKVGNYSLVLNIGGNLVNQVVNFNSNDASDSDDNNGSKNHKSSSEDNSSSHNSTNHNNTSSDNKNHNSTIPSSSSHINDSTNDSQFFPTKSSIPTQTPSKSITPTQTPSQTPSQTPTTTHENIITTTPSPTPSPKSHTGIIVSVVLVLFSIFAIALFIIYKKPELKYQIFRKLGLSRVGNRYSVLSREMMPNSFEDIDEYENELDQFL